MKFKLTQALCALSLLAAVGCGPTHDMPEAGSVAQPPAEESTSEADLLVSGRGGLHVTTDLVWRNTSTGVNSTWRMDGATRITTGALSSAAAEWRLEASADMNLDGHTDFVWRNASTRAVVIWLMSEEQLSSTVSLPAVADANWYIGGAGDMDGDGDQDLVLRNSSTGANTVWIMNRTAFQSNTALTSAATVWLLRGVGDLNGDGNADLVWRNSSTGGNTVWFMSRTTLSSSASLNTESNLQVSLETVADLDWDGRADLVWRNLSTGANSVWYMNGATTRATATLAAESNLGLRIAGTRRGQALVVPLRKAFSARLNFLGTQTTAPTVRDVAATQDTFATGLGIARYEVRVGSVVQPQSGMYLGVTGRDSAGNVRVVLDLALTRAAIEALYQAATTTNPPVPAVTALPQGVLLLQVASATNAPQRTLHSGLMANVVASLRAAGQLSTSGTVSAASLTTPSPGTGRGPRPVTPVFHGEDRSLLRSCWDTMIATAGAVLGCGASLLAMGSPAAPAAAWAAYLTCGGAGLGVVGTLPSCLCTAGITPFGQEMWNSADGLANCSCARTTGQAGAWLGSSPRVPAQSACAHCPTGTTRAVTRELRCYDAATCGTENVTQNYCACPQGTTWNGSACVAYTRVLEFAVIRGIFGCNTVITSPIAVNPCTGRTWYQNQGSGDRSMCVVPYTTAMAAWVDGTPACRAPTRALTNASSCMHTFYASNGATMGNTQGSACWPTANTGENVSEPYILDHWSQDDQGYCVCSRP